MGKPQIAVNGHSLGETSEPSRHRNVVCIKNRNWKKGDPPEGMFFQIPIPEDAEDGEIIPTQQGYTVQYTYRETRKASLLIDSTQERVCHRKLFFDPDFNQVAEHLRFTEWKDAAHDGRVILEHGIIMPKD